MLSFTRQWAESFAWALLEAESRAPVWAGSGFCPKSVCEHHWREKQIRANSHAVYTDAMLSFHSVTPSIKLFTIYALLYRAYIFNHFSWRLPCPSAARGFSRRPSPFPGRDFCLAAKQRSGLSKAVGRGDEENQSKGAKVIPRLLSQPLSATITIQPIAVAVYMSTEVMKALPLLCCGSFHRSQAGGAGWLEMKKRPLQISCGRWEVRTKGSTECNYGSDITPNMQECLLL